MFATFTIITRHYHGQIEERNPGIPIYAYENSLAISRHSSGDNETKRDWRHNVEEENQRG